MDKGVPWLRVAVEGAVIVVSILLAFGIDAWWQSAELKREVAQELQSVGRELRRNQDLLEFQIDIIGRVVRGDDAMLALMEAGGRAPSVSVPDTLAFLVNTSLTFDPSLGALDALVASGRLAAIPDPETRLRLSGLKAFVEDAVDLQLLTRGLYYDQILPIISQEAAYDYDAVTDVSDRFWAAERIPGRALESAISVDYPNTQRLRVLIRERRGLDNTTVAEMTQLLAEFKALASMIGVDE